MNGKIKDIMRLLKTHFEEMEKRREYARNYYSKKKLEKQQAAQP